MIKLYTNKGEEIITLLVYKERFVDIHGNVDIVNRYRVCNPKQDVIEKYVKESLKVKS